MQWEFTDHDPGDLEGAFLLVCVPVTRNVSTVIATTLLRVPTPRLVATIHSDDMPPVSMAYDGVVSGPAHIWAVGGPAGFDGASRELLVLLSDVRLVPGVLMSFSGALARWVQEKKIGFSLAIEGADPNEFAHELAYAATHDGDGALTPLGIVPYTGVHAGLNAAFLARFNQHRLRAAGIFVRVEAGSAGDANAAVVALEAIAPLLPREFAEGDLAEHAKVAAKRAADLRADQRQAQAELGAQVRLDPSYL